MPLVRTVAQRPLLSEADFFNTIDRFQTLPPLFKLQSSCVELDNFSGPFGQYRLYRSWQDVGAP